MSYLNDVRIVSYLSTRPELSISKAGRRYCNFIVRLLFRNDKGENLTDYMNVTCFDDDAEILVRDGDVGDTILITAYLAQQHWWVNDRHLTKVVVIADSVQIIAKGNGQMPPVSVYDERQAQPAPYNVKAGITAFVSSFSIPWQKEIGLRPDMYENPQPQKDGTWTMPSSRINAAVGKFITENPNVANNMRDPIQPNKDADLKRASQLIPEDLPIVFNPKKGRVVFLPTGQQVTEKRYKEILQIQREDLNNMDRDVRDRILKIAKDRYNLTLKMCNLPNHIEHQKMNGANNVDNKGNTDNNSTLDNKNTNQGENYNLFGSNENDWYQDENGKWIMKNL